MGPWLQLSTWRSAGARAQGCNSLPGDKLLHGPRAATLYLEISCFTGPGLQLSTWILLVHRPSAGAPPQPAGYIKLSTDQSFTMAAAFYLEISWFTGPGLALHLSQLAASSYLPINHYQWPELSTWTSTGSWARAWL